MELSGWSIILAVSQWLIYVATAAAIGGNFIGYFASLDERAIKRISDYVIYSVGIGVCASLINFFIQVGAITENGVAGMFASDFVRMLWQSAVGDTLILRVAGFGMALLCGRLVIKFFAASEARSPKRVALIVYILSVLLLAKSFSLVGHTAELAWQSQWLLMIHLILIAWWMGALWPLHIACRELEHFVVYRVMHRFGQWASGAVAVLILCGILLIIQLLPTLDALFSTAYGLTLLIKLSFVSLILILAARHKLNLVPKLKNDSIHRVTLQRSITLEICLGGIVFALTAVMTNLIGVPH